MRVEGEKGGRAITNLIFSKSSTSSSPNTLLHTSTRQSTLVGYLPHNTIMTNNQASIVSVKNPLSMVRIKEVEVREDKFKISSPTNKEDFIWTTQLGIIPLISSSLDKPYYWWQFPNDHIPQIKNLDCISSTIQNYT